MTDQTPGGGTGPAEPPATTTSHSEPLAKALDATLAGLMTAKIASFESAFQQMQTRLGTQTDMLARLKDRLETGGMMRTELDPEIVRAVHRLEAQLGVKLERDDFNQLDEQIHSLEVNLPPPPPRRRRHTRAAFARAHHGPAEPGRAATCLQAHIRDKIEIKSQELDDMHSLLENFTTLGTGIEQARKEYDNAKTAKRVQQPSALLDEHSHEHSHEVFDTT